MDDLDPVTDPDAVALDGHDDIEPVPEDEADRVGAMGRAHELALEDQALEQFPEIRKLGTFGDPTFEEALWAARNLLEVGPDAMREMHAKYDRDGLDDDADVGGDDVELDGP